jgi:hypothetical protein
MGSLDGKDLALAQMVVDGPMRFSHENQALLNLSIQRESCPRERFLRTPDATSRHIHMV